MFLSVIIPVYNCENTVRACLDSVLDGLPDDSEVLLIDDGSKDHSLDICRTYAESDPRIKVILQCHRGPSGARNQGLRAAEGEYLTFADSDDLIDAASFRRYCAAVRDSVKRADLWISDFFRVLPNGAAVDRVFQIPAADTPAIDARQELLQFFRTFGPYWNVWRCFFRRAFLEENEILFPEGYFCAEDLYFMTEVFCKVRHYALLHLPYYRYTVGRTETLSSRITLNRVEDTLDMIKRSYLLLPSMGDRELSNAIHDKLTLEFIMKAALIWELKGEERKTAAAQFQNLLPMASRCTPKRYRFIIWLMSSCGIMLSSWALLLLKRLRQLVRRVRMLPAQHRSSL